MNPAGSTALTILPGCDTRREIPSRRCRPLRSTCSCVGGGAKLNSIGLNSVAWQDFHKLRRGDLAVFDRQDASLDLRGRDSLRSCAMPACRPGFVEPPPELRHAVGDGDDGADRRTPSPARTETSHRRRPAGSARTRRRDRSDRNRRCPRPGASHSSSTIASNKLLLVLEIDVERALGDAGGAGDVVHAGRVEALGQEHRRGRPR